MDHFIKPDNDIEPALPSGSSSAVAGDAAAADARVAPAYGPVEFNIHQPMVSASGEAAKHRYHTAIGKSGKRWVYADIENAGDQVWVDGGKGSQGSAGRTLTFELVDGRSVDLIGPWKTGPDGLLADTGIDIRNQHFTQGIVAFEREVLPWPKGYIFNDIVHYDEAAVLGSWDRVEDIAKATATHAGRTVWFAMVSQGGGVGSWANPEGMDQSRPMPAALAKARPTPQPK